MPRAVSPTGYASSRPPRTAAPPVPRPPATRSSSASALSPEITTAARSTSKKRLSRSRVSLRPKSVSSARQLHRCAVMPAVACEAQGQAAKGREPSTLAPLRHSVSYACRGLAAMCRGRRRESCPAAGWGRSACPVRYGMWDGAMGKLLGHAKRQPPQQPNWRYCHRATSRLNSELLFRNRCFPPIPDAEGRIR
jgi:hypothetical protein